MRIFLFVLALIAFFLGSLSFVSANNAIQEIESLILYLISTVFFSGAAIIDNLIRIETLLKK